MTSTSPGKRGPLVATLIVVAGLAATAGIWLGANLFSPDPGPQQDQMQGATLLPTPKPLAPVNLVDETGQAYSLADLQGRWTFVAIGYTSCPDVCPTTMATFRALAKRIRADTSPTAADFLLVSVDPERDSPERLAQYVHYFDPAFRAATGEHEQLKALMAQLGALYARVEDQGSAMSYLVDHSATIFLIDPRARLAAVFSAPQDPRAMAADFTVIAGSAIHQ